nr:tRNA uridine-5-carboxymethylaminomethyl(34) synthesis GTPase MnmE [bacterium]
MSTIAAIATPPGVGGIAIVRISGPQAFDVLGRVFKTKSGRPLAPRQLVLGRVLGPDGTVLDEAMAVMMPGPHSYTAEDVAEIHCHGSTVVADGVLGACLEAGAAMAGPGEFTRRAFINGRIDLAQAEAVMDLISASGQASARAALEQLQGGLSRRVAAWMDTLTDCRAEIEAAMDFPEEDIPLDTPRLLAALEQLKGELEQALAGARSGKLLREGARCVLVGLPNAGKSALMNALLGFPRAIVTDVPGTTRDTLEEVLLIGGVPIRLTDTAGLRGQGGDAIEEMGMARTRSALEGADIALWVIDSTADGGEAMALWPEIQSARERGCRVLAVLNKSDLPRVLPQGWESRLGVDSVVASALSGDGMKALEDAIRALALPQGEGAILTRARHEQAVRAALEALSQAIEAAYMGMPADIWCADLAQSHAQLAQIGGADATEDCIDRIFERFCLGK